MSDFEHCLKIVLHHEGGYVNHPKDPGGETNMGVTKRVYESIGGTKNMRDLTVEDVTPIYKKNYWDKVKADQLPSGLNLCVFDFGVNAGPVRAVRYLQSLVSVSPDGVFGPNTLAHVDEYIAEEGIKQTIKNYQALREDYYKELKTFSTFGKGWLRRVKEVTLSAIEMVH